MVLQGMASFTYQPIEIPVSMREEEGINEDNVETEDNVSEPMRSTEGVESFNGENIFGLPNIKINLNVVSRQRRRFKVSANTIKEATALRDKHQEQLNL